MNYTGKGTAASDKKLTLAKATILNPNAAEFVPFALRSPSGSTSSTDAPKLSNSTTTMGKAVLDRTESSVSNNSDDEAHQYWRRQLPDDITPDFNVVGEDDSHGINSLPFSRLSINDVNEASLFPASTGSAFMLKDQQELLSPSRINGTSFGEKTGYPIASFGEDASSASFHLPTKPWDKPSLNNHPFANTGEGPHYNGNSGNSFFADMRSEQPSFESDVNPLEFLAFQFPGFAAESLAEVYYANGGDLNLTAEMLTQLELQVEGGLNQNLSSKASSSPTLSALDFPALAENNSLKYCSSDAQQNVNPYGSSDKESTFLFRSGTSIPSRGATDFASAVRKMASQDSSIWKYDRSGVNDASVGSSRHSPVLASSYNGGQSKGVYGQTRGSIRAAPIWLETGEAVANIYSEMREEARDHARLRNAYFEQARHAYLIGNKALAKELSVKGQLQNIQMKAAHGKAQESIYRSRNPVGPEMQGNGRGQERIIDLHGLHVSEAIHVLKRELSVLRNAARSADQRIQVYICVGTGHHTKGSRTPARLPVSVQRYLLEEGLDYSEPQPGLLRVVIY